MIYLDWFGHLFSDESVEELYDFGVKKLGLKPEWNHYSRHFPHFDLTTTAKKAQAKKLGAVYLDSSAELREPMKRAEQVFKALYPLPHYKSTGLYNQPILRVDFKKYFESKPSE